MRRVGARVAWIGCLVVAALGAGHGCGLRLKSGGRPVQPVGAPRATCPFEPVALIIHPLTRLIPEARGGGRIDAHIELRDAVGDDVKGAGRLTIELYRETGPISGVGSREQLLRWEADMGDPSENSRAFDRVTRTYRFELTGVPIEASEDRAMVLRAVLKLPGGAQIADEAGLAR